MLTDPRFWIGALAGAGIYHLWKLRQAAKNGG